jgi:hypothetical protein
LESRGDRIRDEGRVMDVSLKRRARERGIAEYIARELHCLLGPHAPESLAENSDIVCETFSRIFDQHGIVNEAAGARILAYVPVELARLNFKFAEFDRQLNAAIRQGSDRERRHHQ